MTQTIPKGEVARPHLCKLELREDDRWVTEWPGVNLLYPGKWLARMVSSGKTPRLTITHADHSTEVLTQGMSCSCHPIQAADLGVVAVGQPQTHCDLCDEPHAGPYDGSCLL